MDVNQSLVMNGTEEFPDMKPAYGCQASMIELSVTGTIQLAFQGQSIPCGSTIGYGEGMIPVVIPSVSDIHPIRPHARKFLGLYQRQSHITQRELCHGQEGGLGRKIRFVRCYGTERRPISK
jgi:hypothetical protein